MNYGDFRVWRDELLQQRPAMRLDCMNPAKALEHLVGTDVPAAPPASLTALQSCWETVLGLMVDRERLVIGTGVRDLLRVLFGILAAADRTFWLPRDVYPVYWQLAKELRLKSFTTIPTLDWSFLARTGPNDCILLAVPLSPTGRPLSACESVALEAWLNGSANRHLLIDGVYNYSFPLCTDRQSELQMHDRCYSMFSTSKAWLLPQTCGTAIVAAASRADIQERVTTPNEFQRGIACMRLTLESDLPAKLQRRFGQQWLKLQPQIQRIDANWRPPETGYFSIIETPGGELWDEHRVVGVPASVFGSEANVSVITCLFDIKADDLAKR